jgi:hypothetical protein
MLKRGTDTDNLKAFRPIVETGLDMKMIKVFGIDKGKPRQQRYSVLF